MKTRFTILLPLFICGVVACSSAGIMKKESKEFEDIRREYEKVVQVKEIPAEEAPKPTEKPAEKPAEKTPKKTPTKSKPVTPKPAKAKPKPKPKPKKTKKASTRKMKHEPALEDSEGFEGRRPVTDPFRVGESVTLAVKYFNVTAGDVTLAVKPFAEVNGEKSYHFTADILSNRMFSAFYSVKNHAETFVDYDTLVPHTLIVDNNETARVVESRTFFDWKTGMAKLWEKKISKDKGEKTKKLDWKLDPYSQNIISALFYLRVFHFEPGKTLSFRVADDGKNYVFKGTVLRREKLETDVGTFNTQVLKVQFTLGGLLKQSGENLIWITDDDRKFIVRVESKVKIGTLVGKLRSLDRGE